MKHDAVVYLDLNGKTVPVGTLRITADGRYSSCEFQYGKRYLARPDAIPIDPVQLPFKDGNPIQRPPKDFELFNAIRDAGPDAWGRKLIDLHVRRAAGRMPVEAEYLLASRNGTRIGALRFGPDASGPGQVLPFSMPEVSSDLGTIEAFQEMVDMLVRSEPIPDSVLNHIAPGADLGGMRPKATLHIDGAPWLVKFGIDRDRITMASAEAGCLDLAEMCGLPVPERRIVEVAGRPALLLKRFDRDSSAADGIGRRHMISGLTLTNTHESDRGTAGYADLWQGMRKYGADANSGEAIYRRMLISVLVGNTDDHLRNHAYLYQSNGRYEMSPVYDVTPSLQMSETRSLFLHLGQAGSGREATLANAIHAAASLGVEHDRAVDIAISMRETVKSNWQRVLSDRGCTPEDLELVERSFSQACSELQDHLEPRDEYSI